MAFFDPGAACGFAADVGADGLLSGEWDVSNDKHESWGMRGVKLKRLIRELHANTAFTHIGYEKVFAHKGAHAAHCYGMYVAAIQEVAAELGVTHEAVGVGVLKKFATGKGNADKAAMKKAARERWQVFTDSDNEADAVAGLHWLRSQRGAKLKEAAE